MSTIVLPVGFSSFLNIPCTNASVLEGWRLLLLKYSSDLSGGTCGRLLRQPAPTQMFDFQASVATFRLDYFQGLRDKS